MGIDLFDRRTGEIIFSVNFWHYRAIVEAIRTLDVLSEATVDSLHASYQGNGLSASQAKAVARALRRRLIPRLAPGERVLWGGGRTKEPDDGTYHRDPAEYHRNYSTNREVLEEFAECCENCNGFDVC